MVTAYLVKTGQPWAPVMFVVCRDAADGSPYRDGGATPCRSFFYAETLGL